jgi:hypothetical protein
LSADESAEDSDSDSYLEDCDDDVLLAYVLKKVCAFSQNVSCIILNVFLFHLDLNQPAIMPPPRQQSFILDHVSNGEPSSSCHRESYHAPPRSQQQLYPTSDSWSHNSAMQQQTHTAVSNETFQSNYFLYFISSPYRD